MKRVERRGTMEVQQAASLHSMSASLPTSARQLSRTSQVHATTAATAMHRTDTLPATPVSAQLGPGGTHIISPESPYSQHDRSPPTTKIARAPPPSPPAIATLDDGGAGAGAGVAAAAAIVAATPTVAAPTTTTTNTGGLAASSQAHSRSTSRNGRRAPAHRPSATPPIPAETAAHAPVPSKRSPLGSGPSNGSSPRVGPVVKAEGEVAADGDRDADAEADADAEVDAEAEPEGEMDGEADADAEAELLEAVDAAEAIASGPKKEDASL